MKIFLSDAETDYTVDDYEVDLEEALDEFYELSDEDGSFFGMTNDNNQTIQFTWVSDGKWLVDIPIAAKKHSLQKDAGYDECVDLITNFYQGNNPTGIPGLRKFFW